MSQPIKVRSIKERRIELTLSLPESEAKKLLMLIWLRNKGDYQVFFEGESKEKWQFEDGTVLSKLAIKYLKKALKEKDKKQPKLTILPRQ